MKESCQTLQETGAALMRIAEAARAEGLFYGEAIGLNIEDENLTGPTAPFVYKPVTLNPHLIGTLEVIRAAKQNGNPWADSALAEIAILTGTEYVFAYQVAFDRLKYEITIAP